MGGGGGGHFIIMCNNFMLREDSQIFWTLGGQGVLQVDALEISTKSIFDGTNF